MRKVRCSGDRLRRGAVARCQRTGSGESADFATWFAGAVLVPVYETSSPAQVKWNLVDSGAIAVILETPDHFARFDEVHPELPAIRNTWQIDLGDLDKLAAGGAESPTRRSSGAATSPSAPTSRP